MDARKPVVMVIEDDETLRDGLCSLLESRYQVQSATRGEEAVALARKSPPEVVLADLALPGMDGLSTMERMHEEPGLEGLPFVFLSGFADEDTIVRCLDRGAADFVAKPAHYSELLARLGAAVRSRRQLATLEAQAQHDELTGLPNFRALRRRLSEEFKRSARYGQPLALLVVDLDHLKQLNDTYGHSLGNEAIRLVADELRANLRETDFAARFGGDEFYVILPNQGSNEAAVFAERLRRRIANRPLVSSGASLTLTLSIGAASHTFSTAKESEHELVDAAEQALYHAKRAGRDRVAVYEQDGLNGRSQELQ
jgi:diguanylate cyclase (GGDEF)-like protein